MKPINKVMLVLTTFLALSAFASGYNIDFHGDQANCQVTGNMYGGDHTGWGVPAIPGGTYGGQGYDTFCLVIEPEHCTMFAKVAGVRVQTGNEPANTITVKYLDGISGADSFFWTITDESDHPHIIGWVYAEDNSSEEWKTVTFDLPFQIPANTQRYLRFEALGPVWDGCSDWGQLAIDYVEFDGNAEIPEFGTFAAIIALVGGLGGFFLLRKR